MMHWYLLLLGFKTNSCLSCAGHSSMCSRRNHTRTAEAFLQATFMTMFFHPTYLEGDAHGGRESLTKYWAMFFRVEAAGQLKWILGSMILLKSKVEQLAGMVESFACPSSCPSKLNQMCKGVPQCQFWSHNHGGTMCVWSWRYKQFINPPWKRGWSLAVDGCALLIWWRRYGTIHKNGYCLRNIPCCELPGYSGGWLYRFR